ncbi:MAG: RNA polymerase sigma factor [Candidatus Villigracilaceae bacterium]
MIDTSATSISLTALQSGDRNEFASLVEAYSAQIYRLALKILGDTQDAEDVLQNTFLKALQNLPTFEGRSSLSTWLYRIAVNEALMLIRKRRLEAQISAGDSDSDEDEDYLAVQLVDWTTLPEETMLSSEAVTYLDQAIQRLPPKLRLVFLLRDVEGLSIRETSETLGLTETAVKTRLLRARLFLREQLSGYYQERLLERKTDAPPI